MDGGRISDDSSGVDAKQTSRTAWPDRKYLNTGILSCGTRRNDEAPFFRDGINRRARKRRSCRYDDTNMQCSKDVKGHVGADRPAPT